MKQMQPFNLLDTQCWNPTEKFTTTIIIKKVKKSFETCLDNKNRFKNKIKGKYYLKNTIVYVLTTYRLWRPFSCLTQFTSDYQ